MFGICRRSVCPGLFRLAPPPQPPRQILRTRRWKVSLFQWSGRGSLVEAQVSEQDRNNVGPVPTPATGIALAFNYSPVGVVVYAPGTKSLEYPPPHLMWPQVMIRNWSSRNSGFRHGQRNTKSPNKLQEILFITIWYCRYIKYGKYGICFVNAEILRFNLGLDRVNFQLFHKSCNKGFDVPQYPQYSQ